MSLMHRFQFTAALLLTSSSQSLCNALSTTAKPILTSSTNNLESPSTSLITIQQPPQKINPIKSTAAILNLNARSVSQPLVELTRQVLGHENVHVTRTAKEAKLAACSVIGQNYSLVVPMGGDGTLSAWIDNLVSEIMRQGDVASVEKAMEKLPVIGYVPRGTGNGLGHVVGCWQVDGDDKPTNDDGQNKSLLSKINPLSRRKLKKRERTKRLLCRLKEVGDLLQQQRLDNALLNGSDLQSAQTQVLVDSEHDLANKCTIVEMPMMQVIHKEKDSVKSTPTNNVNDKGDLCFFAGSGFDSLMLHDFQQIKAWSSTSKTLPTFLKDALSSVAGYCVALVTLTLPQTLRYGTHKIHVRVTTEDEEALWVDHRRGDFSELAVKKPTTSSSDRVTNGETINGNSQKKQHLLYSGTTGILAASTTPYYGGGLRLFPYARLIPNKLQLRLGRISPLTGFFNIPKIFEGSYREKSDQFGCLDFIGDEFDVEVSSPVYEEYLRRKRHEGGGGWWRRLRGKAIREKKEDDEEGTDGTSDAPPSGFPFQHSGESMGMKERFRLRVVKQPVRFVSFLRPRVVVDE